MSTEKIRKSEIGKRLREFRKLTGLNQAEFGRRVGCTGGNISDIERGKSGPSGPLLQNLEREYGLNGKWLTEGVGPLYKEGVVAEEPAAFPLSKRQREAAGIFEELLDSGDQEILDLLGTQMALLLELARRRKGQK